MLIKIAQNDFGREFPVRLFPFDGQQFSPSDYGLAEYTLSIYRKDSLKIKLDNKDTDNKIDLNTNFIDFYKSGQSIVINGELMTIDSVDYTAKQLTVLRLEPFRKHRAKSIVKQIVYSSTLCVTYDNTNYRHLFTIPQDLELFPGKYLFEIEILTNDRRAVSYGNDPLNLYYLQILETVN